MVAIVQAGPEINFPCHCPSCAPVSAKFQRAAAGVGKLCIPFRQNLPSRMKGEQVGYVTVFRVDFFKFLFPFQQLPFRADSERLEIGTYLFQLAAESSVRIQDTGSVDAVGQQIPGKTEVHARRTA